MAALEPQITIDLQLDVPHPAPARSRRALLAAALGGLAGFVASTLGRPVQAQAAAGGSLILGAANDSGTAQTTLTNAGLGAAFTLKTTNVSTNASGIFGWSSQTGTNATRGVYGKADGPNSYGVFARNSGIGGNGAALFAEGNANAGIVATGETTGIVGVATAATGQPVGVFGLSGADIDNASGVVGSDIGGVAITNGVWGETTSSAGNGVFGRTLVDSPDAWGMFGFATGGGRGVVGYSDTGPGVWAESTTGTALAVVGNTSLTGDLDVTGMLTKGAGAFKIDHPLDPARKFLLHSFVESPDMKNVYDGVAKLDANGEATVTLPDWFDALNGDVRYQLTAVGRPAPGLHVRSGVKNNRFIVAGGEPGMDVSWQVTGIRRDAFANANRIPVEVAKTVTEEGRYLHPKAHGKPDTAAIGAVLKEASARKVGALRDARRRGGRPPA